MKRNVHIRKWKDKKLNSVIEINEYDKVVYMWYYNNQRVIKRVID